MKKLLLSLLIAFSYNAFSQVPGCATLVTPADMATNVTVNPANTSVALAWTAPTTGGAPTGYRIRWGTNPATLAVLGTTPGLGVNITGIQYNTTYYWQALPTNATGDATGCTVVFSFTTQANTDVNCVSGGLYPSATFTPTDCDGETSNQINADAWAGEFSNINLIADNTYTFESSAPGDYVKIVRAAAPTVIVAQGFAPVSWTAIASEVVRFYIHTDDVCSSQDVNRVRSVICAPPTFSVADLDFNSNFAVFPNPATNVVTITSKNSPITAIELTDINGRVVKNNTVNATETQLNISDLSVGVYMLKVSSNEGTSVQKVVKQ